MNYDTLFAKVHAIISRSEDTGKVADYIPELAKIDPSKFGVHLTTIDDEHYSYGDSNEKFSIQSVVKVFSLALAYSKEGHKIWKRVGVEPSGTPFNSLVQLEHDKGIPRNPFINSGAIVIADYLCSNLEHPKEDFLEFIHLCSGKSDVNYNPVVAASEKKEGFRNAALINLMRSFDNIDNDIETVLDFYFDMCSIEMTCAELSRAFILFANKGACPYTREPILTESRTKRMNAIMQLCGFYDEAGEFSFRVGLPGKSGVGGGIVAVLPGKYSIAVWRPKLNVNGNSQRGMEFLECFTSETRISIF